MVVPDLREIVEQLPTRTMPTCRQISLIAWLGPDAGRPFGAISTRTRVYGVQVVERVFTQPVAPMMVMYAIMKPSCPSAGWYVWLRRDTAAVLDIWDLQTTVALDTCSGAASAAAAE